MEATEPQILFSPLLAVVFAGWISRIHPKTLSVRMTVRVLAAISQISSLYPMADSRIPAKY